MTDKNAGYSCDCTGLDFYGKNCETRKFFLCIITNIGIGVRLRYFAYKKDNYFKVALKFGLQEMIWRVF